MLIRPIDSVKKIQLKNVAIERDFSFQLFFTFDFFTSFFFLHRHRIATAVYQVTRPGHEHCDATEGILLDITPLFVDGKKLVTLYDKDLTEGDNLLIGMYFIIII